MTGDRGQVAGIEAMPFGLLVLIGGALIVTNLWAVVDTKFAADAASREAVRHLVEHAGTTDDVAASAAAVAEGVMAEHGRDGSLDVEVDATSLARCARVSVTVSTSIDAVTLPFLGTLGPPFDVRATHSELIDPTRSGVPGEATCLE